jgi:hypothetical protein
VARGDLATAFHEAGHVAAAWSRGLKIHSATIDPTPGFRGHTLHANPLRGIRLNLSLARVRDRAESAIVVYLAGPEAQQRHNPRSWRTHHGDSDFKQAFDLAMGLSTFGEAVRAYLDWLALVTRDEIALLWPQVETVAQALVRERTLTRGGGQIPPGVTMTGDEGDASRVKASLRTNVGRLHPGRADN